MPERKHLLVYPAGLPQKEILQRARDLGYVVVSVDGLAQAPSAALADHFEQVDPSDEDRFLEFVARYHARHPLAGVLISGCDLPVSCARAAALLGTPGISVEAARLTVDKLRMKQVMRAHGVPVPDFHAVASAEEVAGLVEAHGRRMVIKPNDNSGARGVLQIAPGDDYAAKFRHARDNVKRAGVILEAFEPGVQISIEGLVIGGQVRGVSLADRNYEFMDRFFPAIIENGATIPSRLPAEAQADVVARFQEAVTALGIDNSPAKGDMVFGPEGAKVIEVAGRMSGGKFCSQLIPRATGVDLQGAALRLAAGDAVDPDWLTPSRDRGVAVRYFFPPPGRLLAVEGAEQVQAMPGVIELVILPRPGDPLSPIVSHAARSGWVVAEGATPDEAAGLAEQAVRAVRFDVDAAETATP